MYPRPPSPSNEPGAERPPLGGEGRGGGGEKARLRRVQGTHAAGPEPRLTDVLLGQRIVPDFPVLHDAATDGKTSSLTRWAKVNELIREGEPVPAWSPRMFLPPKPVSTSCSTLTPVRDRRDVVALVRPPRPLRVPQRSPRYPTSSAGYPLAGELRLHRRALGRRVRAIFAIIGQRMVYFYRIASGMGGDGTAAPQPAHLSGCCST